MDFSSIPKKEVNDTGDGFRQYDTVNPISRKFSKRLICIDSVFRPHYANTSSCDFVFTMPEHIKKIVSMKISSIEIPNTIYQFSANDLSNTFKIILNGTVYPITIPDGNYNPEEIVAEFYTIFSKYGINTEENTTLSVFYHKSGRLSFDYTGSTDGTLEFDFETEGAKYRRNCGWSLGFKQLSYTAVITETDGVYTGSIDADFIFGASVDKYIFVDVDDYQRNFLTGAVMSVTNRTDTGNSSYLGNNIMAKIPITEAPNAIMFNSGADQLFKTREYFGPVKLEKIRLRLLNKYGELVNLNNEDFSISIELTELY
jgi:hypothetical protein